MRFQSLSVHARLLWLTTGLVIPLVLAGFFNLWSFWLASRAQLDESLEQQADLAASAFEQQLLSHRTTLETVSSHAAHPSSTERLLRYIDSIVETRPQWSDLRITDRSGRTVLSQSVKPPNFPEDLLKGVLDEAARGNSFIVSAEQSPAKRLSFFLLAQPIGDGQYISARVDVASSNSVFENLKLPEENIIAVFDRNNNLIYRNRQLPEQKSIEEIEKPFISLLNKTRDGTVEVASPYDGVERIYGLAPVDTGNYVVAVGVPSDRLYEPARRQFARQAFFGLLIASLAIVAAIALARNIVRPLQRLAEAAREFGRGNLSVRTGTAGGGTIEDLEISFNQMAGEIEVREEKLRALDKLKSEFVSSVSHELRTPLTTIKTLAHVLEDSRISDEERTRYLQMVTNECDRQIEFVQNLLDLSRIESGAYRIELAPTDLTPMLSGIVESRQGQALSRNQTLALTPVQKDAELVLTDEAALRQAISSILENAMKYSPDGGSITVSVERVDDRVNVNVTDDGCGINDDDLPHIFEKFYRGRPRVDSDGQREGINETSGVGLGLYVVANLVERLGGVIYTSNPDGGQRGTTFTVSLPAGNN